MIRVKCIKGYFDTKLSRHVDINEEFNVDENRAKPVVTTTSTSITINITVTDGWGGITISKM